MVARYSEYSKNHGIVIFKMVDFIVWIISKFLKGMNYGYKQHMDEFLKHTADQKKPDMKEYILYNSVRNQWLKSVAA